MTNLMPTDTEVSPSHPAWELEVRRPGRSLQGIVGDLAGYRELASAPVRRRELPAARIIMIFNLGAPLRMAQPNSVGEIVIPRGAGFIAGLHETYTLTETTGEQEGLKVRLSPAGVYRLFGVPMRDLADRTLFLEEIAPAWHRHLIDELLAVPDCRARFHVAEHSLGSRPRDRETSAEVVWAWRQLRQSHGQIPISRLVAELGWSHSRLLTRFREQIGATPKQCARLMRFQQVVQHPSFAPGADWCALAQACGFYDQSHLIREMRAFAGDTPEGLARRRLTGSAGYAAGMGESG